MDGTELTVDTVGKTHFVHKDWTTVIVPCKYDRWNPGSEYKVGNCIQDTDVGTES